MIQIVPLETMNPGDRGTICEICGDHQLVTRLHEMGLCAGAGLRMVQTGRPCIIAINDQRLSLRADENLLILVETRRDTATVPA